MTPAQEIVLELYGLLKMGTPYIPNDLVNDIYSVVKEIKEASIKEDKDLWLEQIMDEIEDQCYDDNYDYDRDLLKQKLLKIIRKSTKQILEDYEGETDKLA